MKNVAIYTRVSTLEQANEGYSLSEQADKLKAYCKVKDWHVHKVYKDGGFSGGSLERPAMNQMLLDAKRKKFDTVLVYKLDRLSRSQKDTLYIIEDVLIKNDISFVSLNENFDTATPFGKAMIGILAVFSQLEREQIKERMQLGKIGRAKAGKAMSWAINPFGYRYENDTYKIVQGESQVVKDMFELYNGGLSITKLRDKMNEEGHPFKDVKWTYRTVKQVLDNPVYCGSIKYSGNIYEGNHEPIISKDLYYSVIQRMEEQRIEQAKRFNEQPFKAKYILSGLIRCGYCDVPMEVRLHKKRKDGSRKRDYKCRAQTSKAHNSLMKQYIEVSDHCPNDYHEATELEMYVLKEIEKLRLNPDLIQGDKLEDNTKQIKDLEKELNKLSKQLNKLVDLYLIDGIDKNSLNQKQRKINKKISSIEKQIDKLRETDESLVIKDLKNSIETNIPITKLDHDTQFTIVRKLIKNVYVYKDKIEIIWKF